MKVGNIEVTEKDGVFYIKTPNGNIFLTHEDYHDLLQALNVFDNGE